MGERGTGKRSLLLEGMRKVHGDGIAMLEAHNDLEVFPGTSRQSYRL